MDKHTEYPVLVSIICLAYNQAPYIENTLNGFITQETNFCFEVLIHDDASTDETANIIRKYESKYPKIIQPIYQKENQYSQGVKIGATYIYPKVRGKYIALCEGDDYWIDPLKLQKQVNFLENHPDYALIYTRAQIYNQETHKTEGYIGANYKGYDSLLSANCIPTLTTCIRTEVMLEYLNDKELQKKGWLMGDYPAWLWIAYYHKIKFLPDITSIYRVLPESASHSQDIQKNEKFILSTIDIVTFFMNKFKIPPTDLYLQSLHHYYFELYEKYIHIAYYERSRHYLNLIDTNHISAHMRKKTRLFYFRYIKFWLKSFL